MNGTVTRVPVVALSKAAARSALREIDALQPAAPPELDSQACVLIALRGRLRDRRREVPVAIWPETERFLREAPGLLVPMWPRRLLEGSEAIHVVQSLMAWHVFALLEGDVDPLLLLMAEGLLTALRVGPQTIVGDEMIDLVDGIVAPTESSRASA